MKELIERINNLLTETDEKIKNAEDCGDDIKYLFWADAKYGMDEVIKVINKYEEEQAKKTFLDRLKEERDELKERLEKLNIFLHKLYVDGTVFVTDTQAHYLKEQREYMQGYLDILDKRLKDLEEGNIVTIGKE